MRASRRHIRTTTLLAAFAASGCSFDGAPPAGGGADANVADAPATPPDAMATGDASPPVARTLVFQDGDGYSGTVDIFVRQSSAATNYGNRSTIEVDGASGNFNFGGPVIGFLRFDGIFGEGPTQVPQTAQIESAILSFVISKGGSSGGEFREALVPWDESYTWISFSNALGPTEGADYGNTQLAVLPNQQGTYDVDVRQSIAEWALNPQLANGWVLVPGGTTSIDLRSGDHDNPAERPRLTITFFEE